MGRVIHLQEILCAFHKDCCYAILKHGGQSYKTIVRVAVEEPSVQRLYHGWYTAERRRNLSTRPVPRGTRRGHPNGGDMQCDMTLHPASNPH